MTNQSNPESKEFSEWADMFPRMSPDCRAIAWEAWQAALSRQPAQTVSEQPSQPEASKEGGAASELHEALGCFEAARIEGLVDVLAESSDERLKDLVTRRILYAEPAIERAIAALASQPVAQQPAQGGREGLQEAIEAMNRAKKLPVWDAIDGRLHIELDTLFKAIDVLSRAQSAAPAVGMTDEQILAAADQVDSENISLIFHGMRGERKPTECAKQFARAPLSAAPAAAPEGWKLVPIEPSVETVTKGRIAYMRVMQGIEPDDHDAMAEAYRAMFAAAPQPVAAQVGELLTEAESAMLDLLISSLNDCINEQLEEGLSAEDVEPERTQHRLLKKFRALAAHPQAAQDKGGDK